MCGVVVLLVSDRVSGAVSDSVWGRGVIGE